MAKVYLTRRATFCAGHRLHSAALSDDENRNIFGKCNHVNGHGHNYELHVTLYGDVNPKTGMVMNLTDLDRLISEAVIARVDHKNLNMDVPEFQALVPTAENIAIVFWNLLKEKLPTLLYEVRLRETENNVAVYRGE